MVLARARLGPSARWGTAEYHAVQTLLKGPEATLHDGATFLDKDSTVRDRARIRWLEPDPTTLGEAMLFQSPPECQATPTFTH